MAQALHFGKAVRVAFLLAICGMGGAATAQGPAAAPPQAALTQPADRQKAVQMDTDHMLHLAKQLKANVDKTRRDELSMQVIREADEIEKLARSVKSRIR